MKLVLAEKPSVAQSIAKVLGAAKREDGYLEGNGYVVSWCVGHLVELAQPEVYDAKYSKWAYADLPIFPMDWQYEVSAGTKKQFGILKKLMAREDVASLVCATDAGREGELIFRLVYHKAGCRKPFERLWISSMEDVAIKEGFENLRSGTEYDALYEAALCRERADWIVGINATRLFFNPLRADPECRSCYDPYPLPWLSCGKLPFPHSSPNRSTLFRLDWTSLLHQVNATRKSQKLKLSATVVL